LRKPADEKVSKRLIHDIERFFDEGLNGDVMLQRVREMIQIYLPHIWQYHKV
jgi:hypothetical protein